jgi:hypothetical protein
VNWSAAVAALVPPSVVTEMPTVPREPAGEVAVIWVGLLTVKVAPVLPNSTALVSVKPLPVIVTDVPPELDPEEGLTELTVGTGGGEPDVMVTFCTWWMSLKPPVPPVKPTSTYGGRLVA